MVQLTGSLLVTGKQEELRTVLLFDLGVCTCLLTCRLPPKFSATGSQGGQRRSSSCDEPGPGQVMPGRLGMLQPPQGEGAWPGKGVRKSWKCQGHAEMSYLQFSPHRPLRNGIMACATCL